MRVVLAWLRLDLRRRWKSLVVVTLLVGVSGGLIVASLAAARRGASVQERLARNTLPATSAVLANTPGFNWDKIAALPEVASLTRFVVDYALYIEGVGGDGVSFPSADSEMLTTIEKPIIFSGRSIDQSKADEVLVSRQFVAHHHKGVGDTLTLDLPTPAQLRKGVDSARPGALHGPRLTLHIVGVGESPWNSDQPGGSGGVVLSAGLAARYPANVLGDVHDKNNTNFVNALIRLKHGEADIPRLRADIARLTGRSDIEVGDLPAQSRDAQRQIAFQARCLVAFALAAFIAALFLIGQAIARYTAASTVELQTLRALGMTPRQSVLNAAAGPTLVGVVGAVIAVIGAYIASLWTPIGSPSLIEPTPGLSADWVVFGPALALIIVFVATGAALSAALAVSSARRPQSNRRSALATTVARAGVAVPIVIGTRFALESGRGRTSVPVRPALIGAVTGVLGIVAAFTFSRGVSDAASNPERFGQTYQLGAFVGINDEDFGPADKLLNALRADPDVTGVDDARTAVATGHGGDGSVSLYSYTGGPKAVPVVITSGRMATAPDEVVLAPRTLTELHTHVGKRVELTGSKAGAKKFLVTGAGLVVEGPHNTYADGGWITSAGYNSIFSGFKFHLVLVGLRHSARIPAAAATLAATVAKADPHLKAVGFEAPTPPSEVGELREVRVLPIALGIFLALLAVGAVGHALATAVRRRSHDLAVLRALGMTQWQCRWVVITQATVLAAVGVVFGLPVGLAVGRSVWRAVADYTPLQYAPPVALWALLLVGPAALIIANLLAAWPGQRAARLRIAHILRTE